LLCPCPFWRTAETSLSHLFYTVKQTGTLPPPAEGEEDGGEEDGGGNATEVGVSPASSSQGGASTIAEGTPGVYHSTGSQQRHQEGSAGGAPGLSAGETEIGGTKRRRGVVNS
jgi:hypothetical protein